MKQDAEGLRGTMATVTERNVHVEELTEAQSHAMFEDLVRDRLGITREEFLSAYDAGQYDNTDSEEVIRLCLLVPFAR